MQLEYFLVLLDKKVKKYIIYSIAAFMLACSSEDDFPVEVVNQELELSNFSIVSFDDDAFYEYRFNGATQEVLQFNLTEQQGLSRQVFLIDRNESVFGFYGPGNAFVKDFETNDLIFVDDFGGEPGEQRITARNDIETLGIIYTFENTDEHFIRVIDISLNFQFEIFLGNFGSDVSLHVKGDDLFVINNNQAGSQLFKISKTAGAITQMLEFGTAMSGVVFGDNETIFLFDFTGNYIELAQNNLTELSTGTNGFIPDSRVTHKYEDGVIFSEFQYPQPDFYSIGPAAFNLVTGEEFNINIANIFDDYKLDNPETLTISPVHFDYDTVNQVWIVAFTAQNASQVERFGYFVINDNQEILRETPLDRLPWTVTVY